MSLTQFSAAGSTGTTGGTGGTGGTRTTGGTGVLTGLFIAPTILAHLVQVLPGLSYAVKPGISNN